VEKEETEEEKKKRAKIQYHSRLFHVVEARGNIWFMKNFRIDPPDQNYLYLYALEQCMSFRELAEKKAGGRPLRDPKWYNDGVAFLKTTQRDDGSGRDDSEAGVVPNTCFALLFLERATGQSVDPWPPPKPPEPPWGPWVKVDEGPLLAESDIIIAQNPKVPLSNLIKERLARAKNGDIRNLNLQDRLAVVRLIAFASRSNYRHDYLPVLIRVLGDPDTRVAGEAHDVLRRAVDDLKEPLSDTIKKSLAGLLANNDIRNLAVQDRLAVVRLIAVAEDFDHAAVLIRALGDKDTSIALEARDALRQMARKPKGFGMPDDPKPFEREAAVAAWKKWYRAVRPEAVF